MIGAPPLHTWCRRWLAEQWDEWSPRTRFSACEALVRFLALAADTEPPGEVRRYLMGALVPGAVVDDEIEVWLAHHLPTLGALGPGQLADIDRRLGLGREGQLLAPSTAGRFRKIARACMARAVDLGVLESDPWPRQRPGRSQRKSQRNRRALDVTSLPGPAMMVAAIEAIRTHQPASWTYQVMTSVAYYAGLRPSEVVMLRARSLTLPASGWGEIRVTEADILLDVPGEPKTGPRTVPIPPVLVHALAAWLADNELSGDQLLFRTRTGSRPAQSNWLRAWHRALADIGHRPLRIYDCRHAAATTWIRAGVPLGEVARRMGHSVDILVSTYVGIINGDEAIANERIEKALG